MGAEYLNDEAPPVAWIKRHEAWIVTLGVITAVVVGIVVAGVAAIAGNAEAVENGWGIALFVALCGGLLRWGYAIGRRSRSQTWERDIAEIRDTIRRLEMGGRNDGRITPITRR